MFVKYVHVIKWVCAVQQTVWYWHNL